MCTIEYNWHSEICILAAENDWSIYRISKHLFWNNYCTKRAKYPGNCNNVFAEVNCNVDPDNIVHTLFGCSYDLSSYMLLHINQIISYKSSRYISMWICDILVLAYWIHTHVRTGLSILDGHVLNSTRNIHENLCLRKFLESEPLENF